LGLHASGEITVTTPRDFLEAHVPRGTTVLLDSPGEDVEAAMELGRLTRLLLLQTQIVPGAGQLNDPRASMAK